MRRTRLLAALSRTLALFLTTAFALAQTTPVRTPTPRPRLSGGFGRPRSTPVPADDGGQSLADAVRAAKETRDQPENTSREKSALTIDNHSLVTNPDKGRISTAKAPPAPAKTKPAPAPASSPAPPVAEPAAHEATPPAAQTAGDEAQWRAAAQAARKRVADGKARVEELAAANKKLENDFYAWDDGQYRDRVIKPAWDKTRDQLEDAKRDLLAAEQELTDLPEKARRAGAEPGWIRE